jgi:hypothetical protein
MHTMNSQSDLPHNTVHTDRWASEDNYDCVFRVPIFQIALRLFSFLYLILWRSLQLTI